MHIKKLLPSRKDRVSGPKPIYKYFDRAEFADALAGGYFHLSTLGACRGYENQERGDKNEGVLKTHLDQMHAEEIGDEHVRQLNQVGIGVMPGATIRNFSIKNATLNESVLDAYVFCATRGFSRDLRGDFGQYCVEITYPERVFELVTQALAKVRTIRSAGVGAVVYSGTHRQARDAHPAHAGFIKDRLFQSQQEVRMLWTVQRDADLQGLGLEVPIISRLCRRVA
jgi:hypothetical protein